MVKVVYKALKSPKAGRSGAAVTAKRVVGPEGKRVTMYTVDAESRTFGEDIGYVFKRNVASARRKNKKLFGSADRAPAKG